MTEGDQGSGLIDSLSVKTLILFHLEQFPPAEDQFTVDREQTQEGIRSILDRGKSIISRELMALINEQLVTSASKHVAAENRRKQVYWLTPAGKQKAAILKQDILEREVELRAADGTIEVHKLQDVNEILGVDLPLTALIALPRSIHHLERAPKEVVRFIPKIPRQFEGRSDELELLHRWLHGDKAAVMLMVKMAGMGKTSLARVFYERQRGERSLLWFTITSWDTPEVFLQVILQTIDGPSDLSPGALQKKFGSDPSSLLHFQ